MTREEYEEQKQHIEAEAEEARQEFVRARKRYDQLCEHARELRRQWQEQQKAADRFDEK
ncbi:hypothetical protein [Streptomyces noursei]|uniref:hypothetical protein n=1 Tax=Streptomyces noursei TaxID=1971 RepID=UPI0035DE9EF7